MALVEQIAENFYCIDTHDSGRPQRTSCYVIIDEKVAIIDTCASSSIPYIKEGIKKLNISLEDIDYAIATHIHLDHAGGMGLFIQECPNATFVVHPRGASHMADPSRLIIGAKAVYQDQFEALFEPILPIPKERILQIEHGEKLSLGKEVLTFYHTDGHAKHHVSIHYSATNGMFVGDTTGVRYPEMNNEKVDLILPSTSPNQYDPKSMEASIQFYETANVDEIYFGHFSVYKNPKEAYRQVRMWTPHFLELGRRALKEESSFDEQVKRVNSELRELVHLYLKEHEIPNNHPIYELIELDISVSAMGIIDYLLKN